MEKLSKVILFLIVVALVCVVIYDQKQNDKILKEGKKTICKLTLFRPRKKNTCDSYVKYYVDDKFYRTKCECPENGEKKLNKFFYLKYLPENPNEIRVDFSKEIKDEKLIKELEAKLTFKYWLNH